GMTDRVHTLYVPETVAAIADQTVATPGPTGPRTATLAPNTGSDSILTAVMVALKPAPSPAATYAYDTRGNRTAITAAGGATTTLAYDQANRLTAYGTTATYAYNGDGLRTSKTVGATSRFSWDLSGDLPLLVSDGTTNYVYGPGGQPLEQITSTAPPAISLVGTATGGDAGGTNLLTITLPAGITRNDQILVASTAGSSNTTTVATDGYTLVGTYPGTTSSATTLFRRTATGGETSLSLHYASYLDPKAVVVVVYRGVNPVQPVDATTAAAAFGSTVSTSSLTTILSNERLLLFQGAYSQINVVPETWVAPTCMTDRAHKSDLPQTSVAVADEVLSSPGSAGPRTASLSPAATAASTDLTAVAVALRPAWTPVLYYHQDQLGSTRALTDATGAVVATATYDPYGKLTATTG